MILMAVAFGAAFLALSISVDAIVPKKTVYLYPKGQDGKKGIVENRVKVTMPALHSTGDNGPEIHGNGFIANVSDSARMDIYIPESPNGQMVICLPGGGYEALSVVNEGESVAKWMNDRGIACAVLMYRMPHQVSEAPLEDVHNAMRYCRYHSREWGVSQIGLIGFSAGGHLTTCAQTMYVDSLTRPDFAIPVYPLTSLEDEYTHKGARNVLTGLDDAISNRDRYSFEEWNERQAWAESQVRKYSTYFNVTPQTPPTFLTASTDDGLVSISNTMKFYKALIDNKVPVELHVFPTGGHGWGFSGDLGACRPEFDEALERWLSEQRTKIGGQAIESHPERWTSKDPDETIFLYPEGQDVDKGIEGVTLGPGESNGMARDEVFGPDNNLRWVGDSARFDLYLADKPNGKMVIVCPGGGYWYTAIVHEGKYAAEWLNSQGVSAVVLKYRLPYGHWNVPLTDVLNTMRYCRHHAKEWGVEKIGVMGFSAGGHLAATASTMYPDKLTRPDFSILVYPVISSEPGVTHEGSMNNLIGTKDSWMTRYTRKDGSLVSFEEWTSNKQKYVELLERYSADLQVSNDTPPTLVISSSNDSGVPQENEIRYYNALVEHKVPCEIHSYPGGGHGWGFRTEQFGKDSIQPYRTSFLNVISRFIGNVK